MSAQDSWQPEPPHDCRVTARCWRESFGFRLDPPYDFSSQRSESTAIDVFFEKRQNDAAGGERQGDRVQKVKQRPVFSLHIGKKTRGATWFEKTRPPQGIVWLCSVEPHDERAKGRDDAYDRFAKQEAAGVLYPLDVDYKALLLARQTRDADWDTPRATAACRELLMTAAESGAAEGTVCGIAVRLRKTLDDPIFVAVAVSMASVQGELSGVEIEMTQERFFLLGAAMKRAANSMTSGEANIDIPTHEFPGGLKNERAFEIAFDV